MTGTLKLGYCEENGNNLLSLTFWQAVEVKKTHQILIFIEIKIRFQIDGSRDETAGD